MKIVYRPDPSGPWIQREKPLRVYRAYNPEDVLDILVKVEAETRKHHLFAAGFLLYEAAGAFNSLYRHHHSSGDLPLAAFALYSPDEFVETDHLQPPTGDFQTSVLVPEIEYSGYEQAFATVRDHIRQGNTYQINLTFRLHAHFAGDPFSWFCAKAEGGHGRYCMYIQDEDFAIASLSPELFFEYSGTPVKNVCMRPMKGTVPATGKDDSLAAHTLSQDPKNCAENLMITDMIRNDIGMIALPGTVHVPALYETEIFSTVIQMTSTVTAETTAPLQEVFSALFPCASITGAPKIKSTEIIHACEKSPREIYTGTIGMVYPDGSARFNVAIRTAWFINKTGRMYYGTGGGITWNSDTKSEWEECMTKTRITHEAEPFYVYDSLLLQDGSYYLQERHADRFSRSALFFQLTVDEASFRRETGEILDRIARDNPRGCFKVRIRAFGPGRDTDVVCDPIQSLPDPYTISLSNISTDTTTVFSSHKTSNRAHLERALESVPEVVDVILVNGNGELAESSRANIVLELGGKKYTPPLTAGLLPGVFREELLSTGEIEEKVLFPDDYIRAEAVYIINSVRRFVLCEKR